MVLLAYSGIYGCVHVADGGIPFKIALPRVGTFLCVGAVLGLVNVSLGGTPFLVFMDGVAQFVNSTVFFWGGIAAKRNGWLQQLEDLPVPAVRFLRFLTLLLVFLIWLLVAISFRNGVSDAQLGVVQGVFSVAISLTFLDLFRRVFTSASKILRFMSDASYAVYLIHPWVITLAVWGYAHALHACGVNIGRTCAYIHPGMKEAGQDKVGGAYLVEADGEGLLWLGWAFVWSVSMLVVWPLAYGIAKLPGLRQIL
uniref:Acyltransferase 3 domain-containing protein n=1 Tax=Zooxanthella nutricula TaxID=1333877 RepID=A0A7S2NLP5_9DINO